MKQASSLNPYCYGISSLTSINSTELITLVVVLILIVMEYLLWPEWKQADNGNRYCVLILIVMEYLLWPFCSAQFNWGRIVLILIVMEYLLWLVLNDALQNEIGLNPYCYGISSLTLGQAHSPTCSLLS